MTYKALISELTEARAVWSSLKLATACVMGLSSPSACSVGLFLNTSRRRSNASAEGRFRHRIFHWPRSSFSRAGGLQPRRRPARIESEPASSSYRPECLGNGQCGPGSVSDRMMALVRRPDGLNSTARLLHLTGQADLPGGSAARSSRDTRTKGGLIGE